MPLRVDLSSNASVKLINVNEENTACAYLANLYIPIFTLDTGRLLHKYEVSNQIAGLQFHPNKKSVLYAVDDSFGLHVFDVRTDSKKKHRLNPDVENHNVICTSLSPSNILAVSSSEFGGGILDVRGSRHREHHPNVISLFDIRYPGEPITTYNKRHKSEITSIEFYKNGNDLLTGDASGAIKSFNCQLRDEDNAIRWERWVKGPITKVGVINKRIVYGISKKAEASVFVDSKGTLEVLYGSVKESANDPIVKTSKAFYKKPEWCVGLIKGVNDEIPLVAVHGVNKEKFISLTAMNQEGVRQAKPMLTYEGHTGEVKCMTVTPELLLTGGEDGKVIIQISNFKNPKFGDDGIDHHKLTLNRGKLAEQHDAEGGDTSDKDEEDEDKDSSDADDAAGPSTSSPTKTKSKKDKEKEKSKEAKKDTSSSSSSSSSKKETKEERQARKEKEAKEKEKAEKKTKKEKEAKVEEKEKKKEKKKETEEERSERKEKERQEKEKKEKKERKEKERKEKERSDRKKKHDEEGGSSSGNVKKSRTK